MDAQELQVIVNNVKGTELLIYVFVISINMMI